MSARVLVMMSGSIAAYKVCHVLSRLKQAGHDIEVVASPWALKFVGEATIEGLTGRPVRKSMFGAGAHMAHINLIRWADLAIVCPATANTINKLSNGVGDDLMTTLFLAHDFSKPWLIAPAMNSQMYHHPATQSAVARLRDMGCDILETASGVLACGEVGDGKLLDSDLLLGEILQRLSTADRATSSPEASPDPTSLGRSPRPGRHVLVTSGGTLEPIDPVRCITNNSTGATGAIVAEVLLGLGHSVHFLSAKGSVQPRFGELDAESRYVSQHFKTFGDLASTLEDALRSQSFDAVVHAAAVSDFRLESGPSSVKIDSAEELTMRFTRTPKLIESLRAWSGNDAMKIVAFKLTVSPNPVERADNVKRLFENSKPDFVVANDLSELPAWQLFQGHSPIPVAEGGERESLGFAISEVVEGRL